MVYREKYLLHRYLKQPFHETLLPLLLFLHVTGTAISVCVCVVCVCVCVCVCGVCVCVCVHARMGVRWFYDNPLTGHNP